MTTHHQLKLNEEFWDAVMSGEKCFEVRKNDRDFRVGDNVGFTTQRWELIDDPLCINTFKRKIFETSKPFRITYVLSGWGIELGYVVFGIKKV